jgi:hypothetical protein
VGSLSRRDQRLATTEQFVIDLTYLIKQLLRLGKGIDALARLVNLVLRFKQERLHLPFGEAAIEIKEGAMLGAIRMATTTGFATFEIALNHGGVENFGGKLEGAQQMSFALAQNQSGLALKG